MIRKLASGEYRLYSRKLDPKTHARREEFLGLPIELEGRAPRRFALVGRSANPDARSYSPESTSSSMIIGTGAFSSSIGITFDGVSGRGG